VLIIEKGKRMGMLLATIMLTWKY